MNEASVNPVDGNPTDGDVAEKRRTRLHPKLRSILDASLKPSRRLLYCAACSAAITTDEARIEINGSHDHRFANPYGFQFHVGCFSDAPACAVSGPPNYADTWFPGHLWRIATCGDCGEHLGWWFEAPGERGFYGLILPKLKSAR